MVYSNATTQVPIQSYIADTDAIFRSVLIAHGGYESAPDVWVIPRTVDMKAVYRELQQYQTINCKV